MVNKEKYVVVKYGGNAFGVGDASVLKDIDNMKKQGVNVVMVHGGGPEITKGLLKLGIESEFKSGLRVTKDQTTASEIAHILSGIGKRIASQLENGIGIIGTDAKMLLAGKKPIMDVDLGYVGEVKKVNTTALKNLCAAGFVPVISPVAQDKGGNFYNINADDAALAIAASLKADKLVFLTNVDGVLKDVNNPDSLLTDLNIAKVPELIREGVISGGMIPKIRSCADGIKKGVGEVYIANGSLEQSILGGLVSGDLSVKATKIFGSPSNQMIQHYAKGNRSK